MIYVNQSGLQTIKQLRGRKYPPATKSLYNWQTVKYNFEAFTAICAGYQAV